jgi:hypothetical protein
MINRIYLQLDRLAMRAQSAAMKTRATYWMAALTWMMALEVWATFATLPVSTLIPVSYPIFVWSKRRVERSRHFKIWCNARLGAEIARVLCVYKACGKSPLALCERLMERLQECQASSPPGVLRLLRDGKSKVPCETHAVPLDFQKEWLYGQAAYLAGTMPRRERQVRLLTALSFGFYGFAIVLAIPGVIAALFGYQFLRGWIAFSVFTAPAIASVIGIFYADVADSHDIARYRNLNARYQEAIHEYGASQTQPGEIAVFERLALMHTIDVLEWWRAKMC